MTIPTPMQEEAFESFPRRDLVFSSGRRQLLTGLAINLRVAQGESEGGVGYKLAWLGSLPDDALAQIVPVVRPDCRITVEDGGVWVVLPEKEAPIHLFTWAPVPLAAFNKMNGETPLSRIGDELAQEMGWPSMRGFAYGRGVFLYLAQLRVCVYREGNTL